MPRYVTAMDKDLVTQVSELSDRVSKLERNPRAIATAIDHGSLIVNIDGKIIVIGTVNERIELYYYSAIGSTVLSSTPDTETSTSDIVMQVSDISFDSINQTFFNYYSLNRDVLNFWGGIWRLGQTFSAVSQVTNGTVDTILGFRKWSLFGVTGNIYMVGRWLNNQQLTTKEAILSGLLNVSAGVSSATVTYAQNYATLMYAIPTLHSASGAVDWSVTAQSVSSFTTAWTGTTAKIINFWNIRM